MSESSLSADQRQRIEANRQRALALRQARTRADHDSPRPTTPTGVVPQQHYSSTSIELAAASDAGGRDANQKRRRPKDSDAGFLIEEEDDSRRDHGHKKQKHTQPPPPRPNSPDRGDNEYYRCEECSAEFYESFIMTNFKVAICNTCRVADKDGDDKYGLVTKTTAKKDYLLLDEDLEGYDDSLPYITRRNPRGQTYSDMKLYLRHHVEQRSFGKFGDEAGLDAEIERRQTVKMERRRGQYEKKVTELRRKTLPRALQSIDRHEHTYGPETTDPKTGETTQTCTTCGMKESFIAF